MIHYVRKYAGKIIHDTCIKIAIFLKNQLLQDIANMPTNEVQETLQQSFYAFLGVRFFMTIYYYYS